MRYEKSIQYLKKDRYLGAFVRRHGPIKHRRRHAGGAFQALAETIIYQQLSGLAAATILKRFIALFNNPSTSLRARKFPTPEDVLKISPEKLRGAGLSNQKANYIKDLAQKFEEGTVSPKKFYAMRDEEVIGYVTKVNGVGEWTAQMFLMFTLGRPDVLPTGDLGIQKAFQKLFKLKKLPSPKQMQKLSKNWSGHRTVACFYLWRLMDEK